MQVLLVVAAAIGARQLDTASKETADMLSGRHDAGSLVGNVVLEAGLRVDSQLSALINRSSEPSVVLPSVHAFAVALGVVNVVLWSARVSAMFVGSY